MIDRDPIRRGDALAAVQEWTYCCDAEEAIAALPAVTVGVPEATVHRAVLDWIRDDAGAAVKMSMTPDRANALTARILATLDLTPAPDAAVKRVVDLLDDLTERQWVIDGLTMSELKEITDAIGAVREVQSHKSE